jgi:hypothetical protein
MVPNQTADGIKSIARRGGEAVNHLFRPTTPCDGTQLENGAYAARWAAIHCRSMKVTGTVQNESAVRVLGVTNRIFEGIDLGVGLTSSAVWRQFKYRTNVVDTATRLSRTKQISVGIADERRGGVVAVGRSPKIMYHSVGKSRIGAGAATAMAWGVKRCMTTSNSTSCSGIL